MNIIYSIFDNFNIMLENNDNIKNMTKTYINEQFDFGKYKVNIDGSATIKDVEKIRTPISGRINISLSTSACNNAVVIQNFSKEFFLEYCNVPIKKINDGETVSAGDLIGQANKGEEIRVTLYNKKRKKINIDSDNAKKLVFGREYEDNDLDSKKKTSKNVSSEPLMSALFKLPFDIVSYPFKDKKDKSGNITQKRWSSPVDKKQPDPWILQSLKDPFGIKRRKSETSNINDEINRIKQLIN